VITLDNLYNRNEWEMEELAQRAYHTWLASLYGSKDAAFLKGVKTWQNLPEKAQQAWQATVEFIWNEAITRYLRETSEIQG
jgi:trehalose-6-phosphatase